MAAQFQDLRKEVSRLRPALPAEDAMARLSKHVPPSFTLEELLEELRSGVDLDSRQKLVQLQACLRLMDRSQSLLGHDVAAGELAGLVCGFISPPACRSDGKDDDDDDDNLEEDGQAKSAIIKSAVEQRKCTASLGIDILEALVKETPSACDSAESLLTVAAYTDAEDAWTDEKTAREARCILDTALEDPVRRRLFMVETVLRDHLRPLFAKSRSAKVTASGRKAEFVRPADGEVTLSNDVRKSRQWVESGAVAQFSWAVSEADEELVSKNWPLFIPLLLALVDNPTTHVRARGLKILGDFLDKFPSQTLVDTGLATVFEEAVFPTLLYLPELTPEDESVQLLRPAYGALISLARKLPDQRGGDDAKQRLLNKVMREGILAGYFHARHHIRIVHVLVQETSAVVSEMGFHAMIHLKDVIPLLYAVISDPFALSTPETLVSAIQALQDTMTRTWARMSTWQNEIIKALVLSWLNVASETDTACRESDKLAVQKELSKTVRMLAAITEAGGASLADLVAPLVEKDPSLRDLFAATGS